MSKKQPKFFGGQQVILTNSRGKREIREVHGIEFDNRVVLKGEKLTAIYDLETGDGVGRWTRDTRIDPATPAELEALRTELAVAELRAIEEQRQIEADPRTPFIRRFRAGDFEKWEKLTLEQLQQISDWLEGK